MTDLRVPGRIDGRGLVGWMHEHRPGVPVIVASGYPVDLNDAPCAQILAVVPKPYAVEDAVAALSRANPS